MRLIKIGSGTLSLTGSSTYAGATVISGGVLQLNGSARNPVSAGLLYDVDASNPKNYTVNGSGYVTQLNDISGHGNNFVNANSTVTAVSGASGFDGKNVLYFNGAANATLAMGNSSSPETVFIIEQVEGSITGDDGMFGWTDNDHDIRIASATSIYNPGNVNDFTNGSGGAMYINAALQSGNAPAGTPQLLAAYAGGSTTSTFPWNSTSLSNNTFMNRDFDGYIGEVVAYSSSLSASQFQAVEAYLNAKWGLGISGLPAATGGGGDNVLPAATSLTIASSAALDLAGGSQQVASLSGAGAFISSNTTAVSVLTLSPSGGSTTFSGAIAGGGTLGAISLVMSGGGTQVLAGSNTYSGPTTVNRGGLVVNGSLASPVTVNGGTLGGSGHLGSVTVNAAGALSPGDPLGTLILSGNLVLTSGAKMDYELDGFPTDDEVSMPYGDLTFNGQGFSNFDFTPLPGFGPGTYTLVDAESIAGLGSNVSGSIDGLPATLSVSNNELLLTVVPEPATLALLVAGALGLIGLGLRRPTARTAKPAAFAQRNAPAILSFPSPSSSASAARRAA